MIINFDQNLYKDLIPAKRLHDKMFSDFLSLIFFNVNSNLMISVSC